jgi:hypothetical protein
MLTLCQNEMDLIRSNHQKTQNFFTGVKMISFGALQEGLETLGKYVGV